MLLEDKIEPLVREIARFLTMTDARAGSRWKGYTGGNLRPLKREKNDRVDYVRSDGAKDGWQARIAAKDIREQAPQASTIVIHPEIVLSSKHKYGNTIIIDNIHSETESGPKELTVRFQDGESEADAISTSMVNEVWATSSQEASAGVEAGPASAEVKVSAEQGWKNTIELAWNKQTGRTRERTVTFRSEEQAPPRTRLEQRLEWQEQTKQRRIECTATIDFGIEMGRRFVVKKRWRWATGSPVKWDSIDHLIAVAEKRGRVEHARYDHFARRPLSAEERQSLEKIKALRMIPVDRLTDPYAGNSNIHVVLIDVDTDTDESDTDEE